jgi:hypothetical protein
MRRAVDAFSWRQEPVRRVRAFSESRTVAAGAGGEAGRGPEAGEGAVVPDPPQAPILVYSEAEGVVELRAVVVPGVSEPWKLEPGARPAERRGLQRDGTTVELGEIADDRETEA